MESRVVLLLALEHSFPGTKLFDVRSQLKQAPIEECMQLLKDKREEDEDRRHQELAFGWEEEGIEMSAKGKKRGRRRVQCKRRTKKQAGTEPAMGHSLALHRVTDYDPDNEMYRCTFKTGYMEGLQDMNEETLSQAVITGPPILIPITTRTLE
eukprot:293365-Rhodomonas_salina.1